MKPPPSPDLQTPPPADWHGVARWYVRDADGATAGRLAALAREPLVLDHAGVRAAWGEAVAAERTVLAGIRHALRGAAAVPSAGGGPPVPLPAGAGPTEKTGGSWETAFDAAVARIAADAAAPAIALGGGLDGAAVLFAWRELGFPLPAVLTLETGAAGYDEVDMAAAIARAVGARCEVVRVSIPELLDLVEPTVRFAQAPLYNLHPVSRLALARAAFGRGYRTLITGDGADAAFVGRPDLDYVPMVAALTHAAGLRLAAPFLEAALLAEILATGPDPEKRRLRRSLTSRGAPAWLIGKPKRARWFPPLDLSACLSGDDSRCCLEANAAMLGLPLQLDTDRRRVGWITLELLLRGLRKEIH